MVSKKKIFQKFNLLDDYLNVQIYINKDVKDLVEFKSIVIDRYGN
jgi:hypothetical protein